MRRIVLFLCLAALCIFGLTFAVGAETELPDLSMVQNVCVYNIENDRVLYSKGEADRVYPASAAKIMTGVLATEFYKDRYSELITVTEASLGEFKGKNIKLKAGEMVTVENLLYAAIVGGANDAANVLAYEMSGNHEIFVGVMNNKAAELGMANTHYTNPFGYSDPDMYTTAEDTVLLAKYAYYVQEYMDICTTVRYVFPETNTSKVRYIYNSNYLLATNVETKYRDKDAIGMNAGSTVEGGHVLVTAAAREGVTNLYVLMGGSYDDENIYTYKAAPELIDWSFDSFEYKKILDSGEMVCEIAVDLSSQVDYVVLSPEKSVEWFLPSSVDTEKDIIRTVKLDKKSIDAPFEAGYVAGSITLSYNGETLAEVDLITKNTVDRNGFLYLLARIQQFTKSSKFKMIIMCVLAVVLIYVFAYIYKKTRSKRYRYRYHKTGKR